MKKLVCEMCGSDDLLKQDGVFVCQGCGCKYSVEEARKMMMEGGGAGAPTASAGGTDAVNQAQIDNYLSMAKSALEGSNNEEAENYANKIIEIDPQNWQAWSIKGTAAGWQTTGRNNRYGESVVAWIKALTYVPEEARGDLRIEVMCPPSRSARPSCRCTATILWTTAARIISWMCSILPKM